MGSWRLVAIVEYASPVGVDTSLAVATYDASYRLDHLASSTLVIAAPYTPGQPGETPPRIDRSFDEPTTSLRPCSYVLRSSWLRRLVPFAYSAVLVPGESEPCVERDDAPGTGYHARRERWRVCARPRTFYREEAAW